MMIRMTVLLALLAVLFVACGPSPEEIAIEFQTAINKQDIGLVLDMMAEDVLIQVDARAINGKVEAMNWLETQIELGLEFEGTPAVTDKSVNFENCIIRSDVWSYFRMDEMTGQCGLELEGGLITSFLLQFDEDSTNRLSASPAILSTDLVSIWTTQWPSPDTEHGDEDFFTYYYLQFNTDGTARLASSQENLSIPPDSGHTVASLIWTYHDFVLTIRNEGAATEGYCLEEDVGIFLVRKDGEGGIRFKPIEDTCLWRKFALQRTGTSWDSYVP